MTRQAIPWMPLSFASREVVVGEKTKIRLHPHLGEFDQATLFRRRLNYEKSVFVWLERHAAQRYEAVIEVGANVGVYSVFFDALIKSQAGCRLGYAYAFEPSRKAYGRLLANLEANSARYVCPFAVAISDRTGFFPFYEPEGALTNGSLSRAYAEQFSGSVHSAATITLAAPVLSGIFSAHAPILLKIDAEGAEPQILAALTPIIQQHSPDLLIEVLPGIDKLLEQVGALASYAKFLLTPDGASPRTTLRADPAERDWLLTRSPHGVAG